MRLLDEIHKRHLISAMELFKGNKKKAAEYLGISIRTLRIWEIKFGLRKQLRMRSGRPLEGN